MNDERKGHDVIRNAALKLLLDLPGIGFVEIFAGLVIQLLEEVGDEVVQNAYEQVPPANLHNIPWRMATKGLSMLPMSTRMPRMILE